MNGLTLSYVKLRFSTQISFKALIDTVACAKVIPKRTFHELRQNRDIEKLLHIENTTLSTVKMASGQLVSTDTEVSVPFRLGNQCFNEKFLVLKSANSLILGNPFFKKHNIQICPKNNLLQFPDMMIQVNSIKETEHENKKTKKLTKIPVLLSKKYILKPGKSTVLECQLQRDENLENVTGVAVPNESLEESTQTSFTSSLSTISSEKKIVYFCFEFCSRSRNIAKQDRNWTLSHFNV